MISFSWRYDFTGAALSWAVSIMFCATGVVCGLLLPFVLVPSAAPGSVQTEGVVARVETDEGMERPVFEYSDRDGVRREFASGISSGRSAYRAGERVAVVFDPARAADAFVRDDKDLLVVLRIVRVLGAVFGAMGLAILGMKLGGMDDRTISRIGGLIGALTYSIPASLALPGLWLAHGARPNWLFAADAAFGADQWLIGSVFSVTGLLALVGTIVLYRYQARTGNSGWRWSWSRSGKTRQ